MVLLECLVEIGVVGYQKKKGMVMNRVVFYNRINRWVNR
jgi:hypothetical protein